MDEIADALEAIDKTLDSVEQLAEQVGSRAALGEALSQLRECSRSAERALAVLKQAKGE